MRGGEEGSGEAGSGQSGRFSRDAVGLIKMPWYAIANNKYLFHQMNERYLS